MSLAEPKADATGPREATAKVFISYSRRDLEFADRIDAALKERGFDTLIDRSEIYALEDWWKRIEALIAQADTIVFILSPDAVASDVCQSEVRFAASLNKRLAPIVWRRVEDSRVPAELARLNFIFFDEPDQFDPSLDRLAEALHTDIEWVRKHTEFGEQARRWVGVGRPGPRGLLLRPPALDEAERWIASRPHNAPIPTEAAQAFITASREAHTRRRNTVSASLAAGLFVALGLAGLAFWQRGVAVEQRGIAVEQRGIAEEQRGIAEQQRGAAEQQRGIAVEQRVAAARAADQATGMTVQQLEIQGQGGLAAAIALASVPGIPNGIGPQTAAALGRAIRRDHELLRASAGDNILRAQATTDGKVLVTGLSNGHIKIWSLPSLELQHDIAAQNDYATELHLSPDETAVLVAGDKIPTVWDLATGKKRFDLAVPNPKKFVAAARWGPDGQTIAVGTADNRLLLFKAADGSLLHEIKGPDIDAIKKHVAARAGEGLGFGIADPLVQGVASAMFLMNGAMTQIAFSPDSKTVAASGAADPDAALRFYDVKSGTLRATGTGPQLTTFSLGRLLGDGIFFDADGKRVAAIAGENNIQIYDPATGKLRQTLSAYGTQSILFTRDGCGVVSAHHDGSIVLWCAETGRQVATLRAHRDSIEHLSFNADETLFAASSDDHTVTIWPMPGTAALCPETGNDAAQARLRSLQPVARLEGHGEVVWRTVFLPDSQVVTISRDTTIRRWRIGERGAAGIPAPKSEGSLLDNTQTRFEATFDQSGEFVLLADTASFHGSVAVWVVSPLQKAGDITDARIAGSIRDGKLRAYKNPFESVAFDPREGMPKAPENADTGDLLRADTGDLRRDDPPTALVVDDWAISPDGQRAVGLRSWHTYFDRRKAGESTDFDVRDDDPKVLFDPVSGQELTELKVTIGDLSWSPHNVDRRSHDGTFSADGSMVFGILKPSDAIDAKAVFAAWDANAGKLIGQIGPVGKVVSFIASDNGRALFLETEESAGADENSLSLYRLAEGAYKEVARSAAGIAAQLPSTAWTVSPDGELAATGDDQGNVHLWRTSDGSVAADLNFGAQTVDSLAISPDGWLIASSDGSKTMRIAEIATGAVIAAPTFPSAAATLRFDPMGKRVVALLANGETQIVDVAPLPGVGSDSAAYADFLRGSQLIPISSVEQLKFHLTPPAPIERADLDALRATSVDALPQRPSRPAEAAACDKLAADPNDREKPAVGVGYRAIDGAAAAEACHAAVQAMPDDPISLYEEGRALQRLGKGAEAAPMLKKAADMSYGAAARALATMIDADSSLTSFGPAQPLWEMAARMGDPYALVMIGGRRALNAKSAEEFTTALGFAKAARPDRLSAGITWMADSADPRDGAPELHRRALFLYDLGLWIADNVKQAGEAESPTYRANIAKRVQVLSREFEPTTVIALWRAAQNWTPGVAAPPEAPADGSSSH
jgi:WD40 repeat protein